MSKLEVRLLPTQSKNYVVLVKGPEGTIMVLTPEEAVDIAQSLLDVAQAAKESNDVSSA